MAKSKDSVSVKGPMQATIHGLCFNPDRLEIILDSPTGRFAKQTIDRGSWSALRTRHHWRLWPCPSWKLQGSKRDGWTGRIWR